MEKKLLVTTKKSLKCINKYATENDFSKTSKKLLTTPWSYDKLYELSLRQQKRILKSCWQTKKIMVNYSGCRKTTEILEKEK